MLSLIKALAKGQNRGWVLELNGKVIEDVRHLCLSHSLFGDLGYGLTLPGYDGWSFKEVGGGGTVMVPFAKIEGRLYIGLVLQGRHNQGGEVWNLPRGFMNPGESHFESLVQELEEELGYISPDKRLKPLLGENMNPNSAFFETPEKNEGVKFFSVEVLPDQLKTMADPFEFKTGIMKPVSKTAELIYTCRFFRWRFAMRVSDMFTVAGVGRLLDAELIRG